MSNASSYTPVLCNTLKRIKNNLINENLSSSLESNFQDNGGRDKVNKPQILSHVILNQHESLFGLAKRVVAVESLVFLGKQFRLLQPYLEFLVPKENHYLLHQFYAQVKQVFKTYMC